MDNEKENTYNQQEIDVQSIIDELNGMSEKLNNMDQELKKAVLKFSASFDDPIKF